MAMRTEKQRQQTKLWVLLGQVTAAQRWHLGMMQALEYEGLSNDLLKAWHNGFVNALKDTEQDIRRKMKEIK